MPHELHALKHYVKFLLSQPICIAELQQLYHEEIAALRLPFLKHFETDKTALREITNRELDVFLHQVVQDKVLQGASGSIAKWLEHGPDSEKTGISDVIRIFSARKLVFLQRLQHYSTDFEACRSVLREFDHVHNILVDKGFEAFLKVHREKVSQEKELLSSIMNNSVAAILAFDTGLRLTEWNNVLERWHSLKRSDVLGRNIFDVFPKHEHTEEGKALLQVLKGEHVFISERPFGEIKGYYEANIFPLYNKSKQITGGVSIIQETTHRKETREKLQTAYDRLQVQQAELIAKNNALRDKQKDIDTKGRALQETITALEESRENATHARDYYLRILEDFPALIWRSGTDGKCNYFNKGWLKFTGRGLADQVGDGWQKAVHPDDLQPYKQRFRKAFGKRESFVMDYRLQNSKGEYRYIVVYVKPVYGLENEFSGFIGACFDIQDRMDAENTVREKNNELTTAFNALAFTEKKLLEANNRLEKSVRERTRDLTAREEQLRLITDAVPVLISYLDRDKRYRFVNKEYEKWFSLKKDDIVGKQAVDVIGQQAFNNILPYVNQAFNGRQVYVDTRQDYENIGSRYINANMIPDIVDGKVEGIYILIYDITSRKKNERTMERLYSDARKKNEELKRINADLDNFIYTASHDLKSPVANLEGLLSHLQKVMGKRVQGEELLLMDMMLQSIEKLKKTILDLVEITKLEKNIEQQARRKVSFSRITGDVKSDLLSLIQESKATIVEEFHVKTLYYVKAGLRSIIYNLLSNALKYRSPDRQSIIRISTAPAPNGKVRLSVEDNGLGMTAAQQKKLFAMFRRLHTHVEGTGIGLYTIKRIIENNGGNIAVFSKVDEVTRFDVFF